MFCPDSVARRGTIRGRSQVSSAAVLSTVEPSLSPAAAPFGRAAMSLSAAAPSLISAAPSLRTAAPPLHPAAPPLSTAAPSLSPAAPPLGLTRTLGAGKYAKNPVGVIGLPDAPRRAWGFLTTENGPPNHSILR